MGLLVTCCHPLLWTRKIGHVKSEMTHMNNNTNVYTGYNTSTETAVIRTFPD